MTVCDFSTCWWCVWWGPIKTETLYIFHTEDFNFGNWLQQYWKSWESNRKNMILSRVVAATAASAIGARNLHLMETLLLPPLLLKDPSQTGRNPGGHIHPQYLPLLEHKAEKWHLPPIFQSHTNASYWQSLTNISRQGDLGNVVSRLPGPCVTQRRPWKSEKAA